MNRIQVYPRLDHLLESKCVLQSISPLTPRENWLHTQAWEADYEEDFVLRYLLPMLYPEALTHDIQLVLGVLVLMVNLMIYGWLWRQGGGPEPGRESGWNPRFLTPLT